MGDGSGAAGLMVRFIGPGWICRAGAPRRRSGSELVVCLVAAPSRATDALISSLRKYRALHVCSTPPDRVVEPGWALHRNPRVILIDQAAGVDRSIRVAAAVRERYPGAPVMMLGEAGEPGATAQTVLRCGASGFVDKKWGALGIARGILASVGAWPGHSASILKHS